MKKSAGVGESCGRCSKPCIHHCGHCMKVAYCSVECQKKDRKRHKYDCYPMDRDDSVYTHNHFDERYQAQRTYSATRDIKAGEVVFQESPLTLGPTTAAPGTKEKIGSVCLACCIQMDGRNSCSVCHWPICGPSCPKINVHKTAECKIFVANNIRFIPSDNKWIQYNRVRYVRALIIKKEDPLRWEQLLKLFRYCDTNDAVAGWLLDLETKTSIDFLKRTCKMTGVDEDTIKKLIRIDMSCGVIAKKADVLHSIYYIDRIHHTIRHSCIPNLRIVGSLVDMTSGPNLIGTVKGIASMDIKKGDELTLMVDEALILDMTWERRNHLFNEYGFWCKCPRCADPTELGTYLSAIKCKKCPAGYLLPKDPLAVNSLTDWICDTCTSKLSHKKIAAVFKRAGDQIDLIQKEAATVGINRVDISLTVSKCCILDKMEKFLEKLENQLHPNFAGNYLLKNLLINGLISLLIRRPATSNVLMRKERLRMVEKLEDLLSYTGKVADTLYPGLSSFQTQNCFSLTMSKWFKLQELVISGGYLETEELARDAMDSYRELRDMVRRLQDTPEKVGWMTEMDFILGAVKVLASNNPGISDRILPIINET